MTNYSRTTLRELKKRYLNVLKKCLLANLGLILLSVPAMADSVAKKNDGSSNIVIDDTQNDGSELLEYLTDETYYVITDGVFSNIIIVESGKVVTYIGEPNIDENGFITYTYKPNGGILNNSGQLTFKGGIVSFERGVSDISGYGVNSGGGAINNSGTITLENSEFINNKVVITGSNSHAFGGAILNNGEMNFGDVRFYNNQLDGMGESMGGAVYNGSSGEMTFSGNVLFENNQTNPSNNQLGGAIANKGTMVFGSNSDVTFFNNSSTWGGAIYNQGNISFDGKVLFEKNTGSSYGVIWNRGSSSILSFKTANFIGNQVGQNSSTVGGVVGNGGLFSITESALFQGNKAAGQNYGTSGGGAIHNTSNGVKDEQGNILTYGAYIKNATFLSNIAEHNGVKLQSTMNAGGGAIINTGTMMLDGYTIFGGYQKDDAGNYVLDENENKISLGNIAHGISFEENGVLYSGNSLGGALLNSGTMVIGPVEFISNLSKSDLGQNMGWGAGGGAVYNEYGTITFTGTALFEDNIAWAGYSAEGGAIKNRPNSGIASINFKGKAEFYNNQSLNVNGSYNLGGAIANNSEMVFEKEAIFGKYVLDENGNKTYDSDGNPITLGNKAISEQSGSSAGAVYNVGKGVFDFKGITTFIGNISNGYTSAEGGAVAHYGNLMKFHDDAEFLDNKAIGQTKPAEGGAIFTDYSSSMIFNKKADFKNNSALGYTAASGGAIFNKTGSATIKQNVDEEGNAILDENGNPSLEPVYTYGMTFNGDTTFTGNKAESETGNSYGGAIRNNSYMLLAGENTFDSNQAKYGGAIYNQGGKKEDDVIAYGMTLGKSTFMGNTALSSGGAIYNYGYMNFTDDALFEGNKASSQGGAIYNQNGIIDFTGDVLFENNESLLGGGAIYNFGANSKLFFNGNVLVKDNTINSKDTAAMGGGINNIGGLITFESCVDFIGQHIISQESNAQGGALTNSGTINFNGKTIFQNNIAEIILTKGGANGGAIYNTGTINFNNEFAFTGNKAIVNNKETPNDIYNHSTINFAHGYAEDGVTPLIGSLAGGIHNAGIINKTGAGTLILGDAMVNSGTGTFNQSAGLTIAHADYFLTGTNNITGGELRVHGADMSNLKATVGSDALLTFLSTSTSEIEMKLGENVSVAGDVKFGAHESIGTAKYHLKDDVTAKTITIQDSILTAENNAFNGAYIMGENVTLDMQDGDTKDSVGFKNLSGESSDLLFDIELKAKTGEGLELASDKLSVQTPTAETYKVKVDLAKINVIGELGDNGLNETYTTKVLEGEAEFETATNELKVFTDVYKYDVTVDDDKKSIKLSGIGASGENALKEAMDYEGNSAFKFSVDGKDYAFNSDTPITLGSGEKNIVGQGVEESKIASGDKKMFVIDNENTSFKISDVALSGTGEIIENKVGSVTLEKVAIEGGKVINKDELMIEDLSVHVVENSGKLTAASSELGTVTNAGTLMLNTGEVSELENTGTLTANSSEISEFVNGNKAEVTGGKVAKFTNKGELTANGSEIGELVNEKEAELTNTTVEDLNNMGKMTAKDLTLKGALKGTGTATLSGKLVADDIFKSENKIISDGMEVSENVKKMELADLEIKEGTTLDIGTREVTAKDVTVGKEATLQVTLNNLDEHGTMKADKIDAGAGAGVHLVLGEKFEGGVFDVFKGTKGAGDLEVKHNNLYNVIEVEEGKYSFMTKDTEALQESLGVTKEEVSVADAMTKGTSTNPSFNKMQSEMLIALQSLETDTVAKAKKALTALSGRSTSLYQSQATAGFTQLHNVVSQMLMNTAAPVFGHNGGEEPARASVYIKGLYDRVNSLTGDGFRMRSKGAVLGVQSAVTEDLTVGVGYAGVDTTAKEPLRRTEVKTNTGFISAQYQPNNWWVSGVVSYSRSQYDEEKQVLSSTGKANYDVDSLGAQITTGYNIKKGKVIVTPEVGIRYLNAKQEGYQDSLGTTVEATNSDFVTAMAGFKVGADLGWVRPLAGVMVGYDVITDDISSVNTLANGATYTINGKALDRLSTTVVAGFGMDIGENATLKLEYNGNYRKEYLDHSGMLRLEWRF